MLSIRIHSLLFSLRNVLARRGSGYRAIGAPAKISMNAKNFLRRNAARPVSIQMEATAALAIQATCWNQMATHAK